MTEEREKKVDAISRRGGRTFYRSVATGTMSMDMSERDAIDRGWGWAVAMGTLMIVLGALAIVFPVLTSVGVALILGMVLTASGALQLIYAFGVRGWRGFLWHLLIAVTYATVGILLLVYPLGGLITLTFLLTLYLLISGIFKVVISLSSRSVSGWGWLLASGILSMILSAVIWLSWPISALWFVGLVVGIDLIMAGFSLAAVAISVHAVAEEEEEM